MHIEYTLFSKQTSDHPVLWRMFKYSRYNNYVLHDASRDFNFANVCKVQYALLIFSIPTYFVPWTIIIN